MGSMSVALSELGYSIVAHTLYRSVSYYSLRVSAESFSFSLCLDAAALQAVSAKTAASFRRNLAFPSHIKQ